MRAAGGASCEGLIVTGPAATAHTPTWLAQTGLELLPLVALAVALVVLGFALVLSRGRRSSSAAGIAVVVLVSGLVLGFAGSSPASASAQCPPSAPAGENSLTITQTSTMNGLAPTVAPVPITGSVVNNGPEGTYVTAIVVSIVSVSRVEPDGTGTCDASDYVVLGPRMAVGETLGPDGGSTTFSGASIGFLDKPVNQDACRGATVHLRYDTA